MRAQGDAGTLVAGLASLNRLGNSRNLEPWQAAGIGYRFTELQTRVRVLTNTSPRVIEAVQGTVDRNSGSGRNLLACAETAARSSFLITTKPYKTLHPDGRSHYEVILWRTQASLRQHRPRGVRLVSGHARGIAQLAIRIDSNERYPWHFGRARVERGPLAVGDYALLEGDRVLAVVERKTFDNLLGDFGTREVLHQQVTHLAAQPLHALVVEADYADFLVPDRVQPWPATYCGGPGRTDGGPPDVADGLLWEPQSRRGMDPQLLPGRVEGGAV